MASMMDDKDRQQRDETTTKKPEIEDLKRLISVGREKGFLTYDELNEVLPEELVSSEQLDDMMMIFDEMDIEIVDSDQQIKVVRDAAGTEAEESADDEEDDLQMEVDAGSRVADPVKMYLREMGQVSLLTREGEVEIAKRIEAGEREAFNAIMESSIGVKEILSLKEKLEKGMSRIRDILRDTDEEMTPEEEEGHKTRTIGMLEEVQRLDEDNKEIKGRLLAQELRGSEEIASKNQLQENKERIVSLLKGLQLDRRQIDRIIDRLRSNLEKIEQAEKDLEDCLLTCGKPLQELQRLYDKGLKENSNSPGTPRNQASPQKSIRP